MAPRTIQISALPSLLELYHYLRMSANSQIKDTILGVHNDGTRHMYIMHVYTRIAAFLGFTYK